ncbi:DUF4249 domain-containing protein [Tannerella forsythia]|uniref:DUF4249 domain-containing protein n=1 Tax=Tannerella forsythia TaxID=28112 RepID=A0A3P1YV66_TANFO|nr:DUF4249 domain-containing protein [Tannerella forsythia]RRD73666.1 DUF4249 domain-containing protein [Tannerella forsythia]
MKAFLSFVLLLALCTGCEEVIDLKLDSQEQQLVVDAALDWEKGKPGNEQKIRLSYTNDYYTNQPSETATGATVLVTASESETYTFVDQGNGDYVCRDFKPEPDKSYRLTIDYKGKRYTSEDRMREVPELTEGNITQRSDGGFSKDEIALRITFPTRSGSDSNFIIKVSYVKNDRVYSRLYAIDNRFYTDGKISRSFTGSNIGGEFLKGDKVEIKVYSVSNAYRQFIDLLTANSLDDAQRGRPMFTSPTRVYGNVVYEPDPKQNPFGAFRVAQYSTILYVVK